MNGKYIIAVSGASHTGKTSTIQGLIKRLGLQIQPGRSKDWLAYGPYCGITVAAGCRGDKYADVEENVEFGIKVNAEIIVTAVRSGDAEIKELKQYAGYEVIAVLRHQLADKDVNNNSALGTILGNIWDKLIDRCVDDIVDTIDVLIAKG